MSVKSERVWQLAEGLYIEPEDFIEAECEIMFYLHSYGNTKAGDLVKFGVNKFGKDPKTIVEMLELMIRRGDLCEVKHDKLKSKPTYFSLRESLPISKLLGVDPVPSMTPK
jgi:hypothetical protein